MFYIFSRNSGKNSCEAVGPLRFICNRVNGWHLSKDMEYQKDQVISGKRGSVAVLLVTIFLICFFLLPAASLLITKLHTASIVLHVSQKTEQTLAGIFVLADEQDLGEGRLRIGLYQLDQYIHTQIMSNLPTYVQDMTNIGEVKMDTADRPEKSMHWADYNSFGLHWHKVSCELEVEDSLGNRHTIVKSVLLLLD